MAISRRDWGVGARERSDRSDLTAPGLIRLENYPIPARLAPYVTALFALRCDEPRIGEVLPAAVGFLLVMFDGKCAFRFDTGHIDPAHPVTLLAPTSAATGLEVEGPWHMLAVELSTVGWMALTGLHAGRHIDRAFDAAEMLGADAAALGERLRARIHAGLGGGAELIAELAGFIEPRLRPLKPRHAALISSVTEWLYASFDPQPTELRQATGYSARQLQRLVERYFGTGPKQLSRKYRALRVAGLMISKECDEERIAELLNHFYDQSHMIREMRHFVGRTPLKFDKNRSSMLAAVAELRKHRELRPDLVQGKGN